MPSPRARLEEAMERLGLRILVVEDNFLEAEMMENTLHDAGCTVVGPTRRLAEALALATQSPLDGALLDINLGGLMSFATAWELTYRGVPFAFVSGYPQSSVPGPGPLRAAPFLSKPVDERELVQTVSDFAPKPPTEAPSAAKPPRRLKRRRLNF
jgi:CheY-like chemotaxis protein